MVDAAAAFNSDALLTMTSSYCGNRWVCDSDLVMAIIFARKCQVSIRIVYKLPLTKNLHSFAPIALRYRNLETNFNSAALTV